MKQIIIFIFLFLSSCTINTPSEGKKIGRIVKIAHEGIFSSTWEGELIRGGLTDGSGSIGTSFHFTIEDENIFLLAIQYMESQKEVEIYYRCEFISSCFRSEMGHPYFVTRIKVME